MNKNEKLTTNEWLAFYIHQDNMLWSQLQTLGVIQIAGLSAAYILKEIILLSFSVIILGAILTILIFLFMKRAELSRIDAENHLKEIDFNPGRKWYAPLKGREIAWILLTLLLAIDASFVIFLILN